MSEGFWEFIQRLVEGSEIVIDRPRGANHPRYPIGRYPVDYGYLQGTMAMDGGGVDIWVGSMGEKRVVGVLGTVDLMKRDTELKVLFDCTPAEIEAILSFVNTNDMRAIHIKREK